MSEVLLSIEPRLPPAVCGTGTFGWELARHWPDQAEHFLHLVVDGAEASGRHFGTEKIFGTGQSGARLFAKMQRHPVAGVILHYASRGYHRYGIPLWLARGLGKWRRANPSARMLVFFHEVPQSLPLTSRHYVLERINRGIIRTLCRLADAVVTNSPEHAERLANLSGRSGIPWVWIPSNIPAPQSTAAAVRNAGDFVVFGLPFTQLLTVQEFAAELKAWHGAGLLTRLHLVGPGDAKFSPKTDALLTEFLPESAVIRHGVLEPPAVSRILREAGFCITQSSAANLSKSGTFAAFAAHGCAVVAKMGGESAQPPMCYLIHPEEMQQLVARGDDVIGQRSRALEAWYAQTAAWPVVAAEVARIFERTRVPK